MAQYLETRPLYRKEYWEGLGPLQVRAPRDFLNDLDVVAALDDLTRSVPELDMVHCARAVALIYAEVSEIDPQPVGPQVLNLLATLLYSDDEEVQRAASAALGNLAVIGSYFRSVILIRQGGLYWPL
jgi:vacuolar protein 8